MGGGGQQERIMGVALITMRVGLKKKNFEMHGFNCLWLSGGMLI